MVEPPKHQAWRITVRAKSKSLDFRLTASNVLPHCGNGGERIAFFLRLRGFFLRVESKNQSPSGRVAAVRNAAAPFAKPFQLLRVVFRRPRWLPRKNVASKSRSASSKIGSFFTDSRLCISQVIPPWMLLFIEQRWMKWLVIFALVLLLSCIFGVPSVYLWGMEITKMLAPSGYTRTLG
ncbi:uncharacterized protein LOC135581477 isoform X1 [Musa acuminata AAA Group]|uniref:uncharacterized protein LOC135581477 isoform X1 n=1 Tax=Musa acuminata AAA Group TaxID=214697 RepID=UPI0031D01E7D